MARSSFRSPRPSRHSRARQPDTARPPQGARGSTVLPLHHPSSVAQCRAGLLEALAGLAEAWRTLDLRDEPGWSAFAGDAALDLARYLTQHAADVRAAGAARGGSHRPAWLAEDDGSPCATEDHTSADDSFDVTMSVSAASAADAVALAFLGVVDALAPADAVLDIVNAAAALGVVDLDGLKRDLTAVSVDRQAS